MTPDRTVLSTYSRMAEVYDDRRNVDSCWGIDTAKRIETFDPKPHHRLIADVGCGTGVALEKVAERAHPEARIVGVEPADRMRERAAEATKHLPNVELLPGSFESIPLEDASVDYMISINAYHWSSDLDAAMDEVERVSHSGTEMDHYFIGRDIGQEFIRVTTPVFLKYMGPKKLLEAAAMRQSLTREQAEARFVDKFGRDRVTVEEHYDTYYDTVEGHLGWWVRIEPQLLSIPEDRREEYDREVRAALASLDEGKGVPYTKHTIHAHVSGAA